MVYRFQSKYIKHPNTRHQQLQQGKMHALSQQISTGDTQVHTFCGLTLQIDLDNFIDRFKEFDPKAKRACKSCKRFLESRKS